jgi:Fe-S oxidoreductase
VREGSLEAPTRHPLAWKEADFWDPQKAEKELERIFEICHGCRRCVNLCTTFPTLFDLVDASSTLEVDGVAKQDYAKVVDQCYLCDLCYMTKCPYVPPHPWNVDFPHVMLRAKAIKFKKGIKFRDRLLSSTDALGKLAAIPVVAQTVNAVNRNGFARSVLQSTLGVHKERELPPYAPRKFRSAARTKFSFPVRDGKNTPGKVAIFSTCYVNYNEPAMGHDLAAILEHNQIPYVIVEKEVCCGMPKLELGDLEGVAQLKERNIPELVRLVDAGWDIVAPVPSCTLMFKQELPLMFPDDAQVAKVRDAMFDPFEYLWARYKGGLLRTDFTRKLGKISYHVPCHLRVQNLGLKTRDVLMLVPETQVEAIERCSGHNGTYGVKREYRDVSMKIARPVVRRVVDSGADFYSSDCPMAGHQIESGMEQPREPTHPLKLLRMAYGI